MLLYPKSYIHLLCEPLPSDPVHNVVQVLEKQYLEEKRNALEEQRLMYERELEQLRHQLSPERQHQHGNERDSYTSQTAQQKMRVWAEERLELSLQDVYSTNVLERVYCSTHLPDIARGFINHFNITIAINVPVVEHKQHRHCTLAYRHEKVKVHNL